MEPLVTSQRVLTWLWMYSDDTVSSKWKKLVQRAGGQLCLIFQLVGFAGATIFIMKFVSIDVEKSFYAFMFASGLFDSACTATQAMLSRRKITGIFTRLSKIYRDSK